MYKGDTSYDIFEGLQTVGILPRDDSPLFKALLKPTRLFGVWQSLRERFHLSSLK